jgi:hypothetical protein
MRWRCVRLRRPLTWQGAHPLVELVTMTKQARAAVEARLTLLPHLGNWFVDTPCS